MPAAALTGLVVLALESRRASEIAELIRRHGGTPLIAPALREVPLDENQPAFAFLAQLEQAAIDIVILLTGVGTRTLAAAIEPRCAHDRFADLLRRVKLVARGPKPVAVLREFGLTPAVTIPEPNTWREILATLDRDLPVRGLRVAVQEYGVPNPELCDGLRQRGATVTTVPVYRWALPEDTEPLRTAVAELVAGRVDIGLFTSATQVEHLALIANQEGVDPSRLRTAFQHVLIASIGPVCSAALRAHGLPPDIEPEHSKMGHLVAAAARSGSALLHSKRGA